MNDLETVKPEVEAAIKASDISNVVIVTSEDYLNAGKLLKSIKDIKKRLDEKRLKMTRPLDASKKMIMDLFKPAIEKCEAAINELDQKKMIPWREEQDRKAREEQVRLDKLAHEEAEKKRLAEIEEAIGFGADDIAEELLAAPVESEPVAQVRAAIPTSSAVFSRSTWSAEVTDVNALFSAFKEGKVPQECFSIDMPFLNSMARKYENALNFPGVKAVEKKSTSGR